MNPATPSSGGGHNAAAVGRQNGRVGFMENLPKLAGVCPGINPAAPITPDTAVVGSLPTTAGWYCIKNGEASPLYMILGSPVCVVVREGDMI